MNIKTTILISFLTLSSILFGQEKPKKVKNSGNNTLGLSSKGGIPELKGTKSAKPIGIMEINSIKYFTVNGIRVILKPANNEVVSINYIISGGVKNYSLAQQGIENLTLATIFDGGSVKYPKENYHNITESKGISISPVVNYDYSIIQVQSTTKTFNEAWDISADVLTNPIWDEQSLEQMRNQIATGLLQNAQDPDESLQELARKGIYTGTPYEKNPDGTVEVINSLKMEDLKAFYKNLLLGNKMIISVCGKIDADELKSKIQKSFGTIEKGKKDVFESNPPLIAENKVTIEEREIATNYIRGQLNAPKFGTREYLALKIAYYIFSDRLFVEVRTKRNLSYAPSASVSSLNNPVSYMYVSTTDPNRATEVMIEEMKKIKKAGFSEKELKNQKESFLTSYFMGQETNAGQAANLGVAELRFGYQYALDYNAQIQSLTLKEINEAFNKYTSKIHWFYLGDKSKVDESIFNGLK